VPLRPFPAVSPQAARKLRNESVLALGVTVLALAGAFALGGGSAPRVWLRPRAGREFAVCQSIISRTDDRCKDECKFAAEKDSISPNGNVGERVKCSTAQRRQSE